MYYIHGIRCQQKSTQLVSQYIENDILTYIAWLYFSLVPCSTAPLRVPHSASLSLQESLQSFSGLMWSFFTASSGLDGAREDPSPKPSSLHRWYREAHTNTTINNPPHALNQAAVHYFHKDLVFGIMGNGETFKNNKQLKSKLGRDIIVSKDGSHAVTQTIKGQKDLYGFENYTTIYLEMFWLKTAAVCFRKVSRRRDRSRYCRWSGLANCERVASPTPSCPEAIGRG